MSIGTQDRGLIHKTLRTSNSSFIRKVYNSMQETRHISFTNTNEEGLTRVREYNYAFLIPNRIAEYLANKKPCDLYVINTTLFRHHFAFATPKNSALLPFLNNGLHVLRNEGHLDDIYQRWWIEKGECNGDTRRHVPEKTMRYEHVTKYGSSTISLHSGLKMSLSGRGRTTRLP